MNRTDLYEFNKKIIGYHVHDRFKFVLFIFYNPFEMYNKIFISENFI